MLGYLVVFMKEAGVFTFSKQNNKCKYTAKELNM